MRKLLLVLALTILSLFGASFDCSKAKSDVEKMICVDIALIKADDTLNHLFQTLKTSDRLSADVIQRHKEWLSNRNQCKDLNCLYNVYNHQLEYLESKIEYQFATDQKESCGQFVDIFNKNLDVIRHGNFSASPAEYNGLKWLQPKVDIEHGAAMYGDVDINNDGKKEFVVADIYPDIGTSRRIIYYVSKETYPHEKALANFNSIDLNIFKGTNFSNLLHQKKVFTRFPDENGLSFPHVALFQYKDSIYVFMEMVIGADSDGQFVENIIQYGDLFVVSRFNSNNQQQDICLIYKLLK